MKVMNSSTVHRLTTTSTQVSANAKPPSRKSSPDTDLRCAAPPNSGSYLDTKPLDGEPHSHTAIVTVITYCQYRSDPIMFISVTVSDTVSKLFIKDELYGSTRMWSTKKKIIQMDAANTCKKGSDRITDKPMTPTLRMSTMASHQYHPLGMS